MSREQNNLTSVAPLEVAQGCEDDRENAGNIECSLFLLPHDQARFARVCDCSGTNSDQIDERSARFRRGAQQQSLDQRNFRPSAGTGENLPVCCAACLGYSLLTRDSHKNRSATPELEYRHNRIQTGLLRWHVVLGQLQNRAGPQSNRRPRSTARISANSSSATTKSAMRNHRR